MIPDIRPEVSSRLTLDLSTAIAIQSPAASPIHSQIHAAVGAYQLRMAVTQEDRDAACRLRFRVFNVELGEGLEISYQTGLDQDRFDAACEHLLVEDRATGRVVGTYRMQSGTSAAHHEGYYSAQEFVLAPYEALRPGILELGRAAVDREHRTPEVLTLLWRGIAQYATRMGLRYLLGCSSINFNDPAVGWQMYRQLDRFCVPPEFETVPTAAYACPSEQQGAGAQPPQLPGDGHESSSSPVKVPKLLKTYLALGARIAAPPAWDREFHTIDFLTLLDLESLAPAARVRFLGPLST